MPRVAKKSTRTKAAKAQADGEDSPRTEESEGAVATAVAEAPPSESLPTESNELEVPTKPVEPAEEAATEPIRTPAEPGTTINIAKLQAMSMTELNAMAREMAVENFGTMRKHEVIFHILQKNAARSGILFSEGVL